LYGHGFVRVAAAVPRVRVAEPAFNAERTLALARQASDADAALVLFPSWDCPRTRTRIFSVSGH
jgi:NAD+ synthase (glutamine-hydrolysing)